MHHTPLIATIVAGLSIAFVFGAIAQRLRVSPLVGYLLAGLVVGPFTPGYVADQALATELAEIGVILLMFGVGLHFSLKELLSVRAIAIPGAVAQMAVATVLGMGLAHLLGWSLVSGFVFGLALSVASTVVLLRALQERRIVQTDRGHIAIGWLIVEDLAMVLALVLLPALARATYGGGGGDPVTSWVLPLGLTAAKVAAFVAVMLIVGRRVIPWVLHYVAHTGSRELFRLAVLSIALGVAFGAATLFDVSLALGAFFAGMILAESELSQRAAEETLPLRDAFAVLFFVSVGMLFNPYVVMNSPWPLLATVAIIVVGKSVAAFAIVKLFRHSTQTALTVAASLAQIGEFSFILAGLGVGLKLLPPEGRDLILVGAIISIVLNPLVFGIAAWISRPKAQAPVADTPPPANDLFPTQLTEHNVVVGFGRVGSVLAQGLEVGDQPFLVIEDRSDPCARARTLGYEVLVGSGADGRVLSAARIAEAKRLFVAVPDAFEAGQIVEQARRANAGLEIIARAHSEDERQHLLNHGADEAIMAEHEIAGAMLERVLARARKARKEAEEPPPDGRPVLDDAEHAILAAIRELKIGPGEAVSRDTLVEQANHTSHFRPERLAGALDSLRGKDWLLDLGDGRVAPSKLCFLTAQT